jgi:D-alanyl-D-alanine endopeptidase (penicillin-binding protein 7)
MSVLVVDQDRENVLLEKNSTVRRPIASITKLMTAMVVLDAKQPSQELLRITDADVDRLKHSRSRLPVGTRLTRAELLHLALLASENRAASALSRNYPGGKQAFVAAMNRKARFLGMLSTHFDDPTGLFPSDTSTARDLERMVRAAYTYPTIRQITSSPEYVLDHQGRLDGVHFRNTNRLVRSEDWTIGLSKTGYIREAGRCLVMQVDIADRPILIVLLHSQGRGSHFVDAARLRRWIERRVLVSSNGS